MKNAPNRLRGYYGAAKAAEASGDRKKGCGLLRQARAAHPGR